MVFKAQVADALFATGEPEQLSLPVAVTVLVTAQASAGAVKVALKLAEAPGARLATVRTVAGTVWPLTTFTLFNWTLPVFRTVPV